MGAEPQYLSCGVIIEEGFSINDLTTIVRSMAKELKQSGARIVCGDTKVVPRAAPMVYLLIPQALAASCVPTSQRQTLHRGRCHYCFP